MMISINNVMKIGSILLVGGLICGFKIILDATKNTGNLADIATTKQQRLQPTNNKNASTKDNIFLPTQKEEFEDEMARIHNEIRTDGGKVEGEEKGERGVNNKKEDPAITVSTMPTVNEEEEEEEEENQHGTEVGKGINNMKEEDIKVVVNYHDNQMEPIFCDREGYVLDKVDYICKDKDNPNAHFAKSCTCSFPCYTPDAAHESPWPYESYEEKSSFIFQGEYELAQQQKPKEEYAYKKRFICPSSSTTSATTFKNNTTNNLIAAYDRTNNTDSNENQKQQNIPYEELAIAKGKFMHHFFFIPKAKLAFCGIPKGGITEWNKFARYVFGAQDYLALPHYKKDRGVFHMARLPLIKIYEILTDPEWTVSMFVRDPAERLLSAYSDKILNEGFTHTFWKIYNGTDGYYKKPAGEFTRKNAKEEYVLSFREFVNLVTYQNTTKLGKVEKRGVSYGHVDPHWKPQMMTCGMNYLLPYLDFIGNFNHIGIHTKMLLERVNLWEQYGSKFDPADDDIYELSNITSKKIIQCNPPPPKPLRDRLPHLYTNYTPPGFNQRGPSSTTAHLTNTKEKMKKFYTPQLLNKVREAYKYDYEIWDDIKDRNVDDVIAGKDLSIVKAYCN